MAAFKNIGSAAEPVRLRLQLKPVYERDSFSGRMIRRQRDILLTRRPKSERGEQSASRKIISDENLRRYGDTEPGGRGFQHEVKMLKLLPT